MIIIIGAGLAGYQLAREFRKLDPSTPLTLITADDGRFYPKPQLSTALTSKKSAAMLATTTAEMMATQLNIVVRTHSHVDAIDPMSHTLMIGDEKIAFDKLVLACGADVIKAPIGGNAATNILSVNHIYHYMEFEKLILNKKIISILGAGLIGCEFANDLSNAGYEVHVIAPDQWVLERFMPESVGRVLQEALEKNGVHFHLGCVAQQVNKVGENFCLTLSDGSSLYAEFVLSAIGLKPHVELAKSAQLKIDRGILVNRYLESSVENIYALGDCAEVEGHVLPFITPILNGARALAKTLAGEHTPVEYPAMPVTVKTPAHPIVICPPQQGVKGQWEMSREGDSLKALFYGDQRQLYGFVLTNEAVKERMSLVKLIPNWL